MDLNPQQPPQDQDENPAPGTFGAGQVPGGADQPGQDAGAPAGPQQPPAPVTPPPTFGGSEGGDQEVTPPAGPTVGEEGVPPAEPSKEEPQQ